MRGGSPERLGAILLQYNLISERDLHEALEIQKRVRERLGEILVRLGRLSENELTWSLANQLNLPCVSAIDTRPGFVDASALDLVPRSLAYRHHILPFLVCGDELTVITDDPLDREGLNAVALASGLQVSVATGPTTEILEALNTLYGAKAEADGAADRLGEHAAEDDGCDPLDAFLNRMILRGIRRLALEPGGDRGCPVLRPRKPGGTREDLEPSHFNALIRRLKEASGVSSVDAPMVRPFEFKSYRGTAAFGPCPGGVTAALNLELPESVFQWPSEWTPALRERLRGPGLWLVGTGVRTLWAPVVYGIRRALEPDRRVLGAGQGGTEKDKSPGIDYSTGVVSGLIGLEPDVLILPAEARSALIETLRGGLPECAILLQVAARTPVRALQVFQGIGVSGPELAEMVRGVLCFSTLEPGDVAENLDGATGGSADGGAGGGLGSGQSDRLGPAYDQGHGRIPILGWYELNRDVEDALSRGVPVGELGERLSAGPVPRPDEQVRKYVEQGIVSGKMTDLCVGAEV